MVCFTGNGFCSYPLNGTWSEDPDTSSLPQSDGPRDPRRYPGAAMSSHLFGQPYNPPHRDRSASVNPQPISQAQNQSPHFSDRYSTQANRNRQSSVAPFPIPIPQQQERSPYFSSTQPVTDYDSGNQHKHHRRSSDFPFTSGSQPASVMSRSIASRASSQPTYKIAGNEYLGLLPWITAPIPLSDKEAIMLSDVGPSLREVMLAALTAVIDPGAREALEDAVGPKTAEKVIDFWTEEFAMQ